MIADKPTPGLDLEMALEALTCFREMEDEGKAVTLISLSSVPILLPIQSLFLQQLQR